MVQNGHFLTVSDDNYVSKKKKKRKDESLAYSLPLIVNYSSSISGTLAVTFEVF